ncbi:MAG: hypothetical protein H0V56_01155 [Chthoniobacterales bacterium]|nr:hypothetical protein [Chthoniobacterales bacterium]
MWVLLTGTVGVIVTSMCVGFAGSVAVLTWLGVIFPVLVVVGKLVRAVTFARAEEDESGRGRNDRGFS